jgi:hypothetical protein
MSIFSIFIFKKNRLGRKGLPKTNTALLYINESTKPHVKWGEQALIYEPSRRVERENHYIIERFKLLLDEDASKDSLPVLPRHLDIKTVISDYFVKLKGVCNIHKTFPLFLRYLPKIIHYRIIIFKGN